MIEISDFVQYSLTLPPNTESLAHQKSIEMKGLKIGKILIRNIGEGPLTLQDPVNPTLMTKIFVNQEANLQAKIDTAGLKTAIIEREGKAETSKEIGSFHLATGNSTTVSV